jgi:hypothetical protein
MHWKSDPRPRVALWTPPFVFSCRLRLKAAIERCVARVPVFACPVSRNGWVMYECARAWEQWNWDAFERLTVFSDLILKFKNDIFFKHSYIHQQRPWTQLHWNQTQLYVNFERMPINSDVITWKWWPDAWTPMVWDVAWKRTLKLICNLLWGDLSVVGSIFIFSSTKHGFSPQKSMFEPRDHFEGINECLQRFPALMFCCCGIVTLVDIRK